MVDFADKVVALVGRLNSMSHRLAAAELARLGGAARRGLVRRADVAIVGRGAHVLLRSGRLERILAEADALGLACVSENAFLAAAGHRTPPDPANRTIPVEIMARRAGLDAHTARILELFDVIEPVEGNCGFQDLVAAKEVARLCAEGVALADIVAGAVALGPGAPLSAVKLARSRSGALVMRIGDGYADLDGQLRLPMPDAGNPSADEMFEAAEIAEDAGDWVTAERHYRRAVDHDGGDQSAAFNLANALRRSGAWRRGTDLSAARAGDRSRLRRGLVQPRRIPRRRRRSRRCQGESGEGARHRRRLRRCALQSRPAPLRGRRLRPRARVLGALPDLGPAKRMGREGAPRHGRLPPPRQARPLSR